MQSIPIKLARGARENPNGERQSREMANCFGDIVDNYKLDTMPRYVGKTKTREDRAREASYLSNENEKYKKAKECVCIIIVFFSLSNAYACLYNRGRSSMYIIC